MQCAIHILSVNIAFLVGHNLANGSTALLRNGLRVRFYFNTQKGLSLLLPSIRVTAGLNILQNLKWKTLRTTASPKNHSACQVAIEIQHMEIRFSALKECDGKPAALPRWFLQLWHSIPSSS